MDQMSLIGANEVYRFPEELLEYSEAFLSAEEASALKDTLIETASWQQTTIKMYDKVLMTPRLIAWYGDPDTIYRLAGQQVKTETWTPELLALKHKVEAHSGHRFNSVLLNYYRDGNDSVAWHRDKESVLGNRPVIASLSLGQV